MIINQHNFTFDYAMHLPELSLLNSLTMSYLMWITIECIHSTGQAIECVHSMAELWNV